MRHRLIWVALASAIFVSTTAYAQPNPGVRQPPAPRVPEGVKAIRDVPYVADGHARQKLDLYLPEKSDGPLPLIIWVHGGGWQGGSKTGCPPARDNYMARGYAVASIGYRLSGDAIFPAQIEDCKAAIRWLRAHAKEHNLNPDRFAAWGSSAGGHLVALLGTSGDIRAFDVGAHLDQSSRVQAVCDYYGPTDLLQMDAHALNKQRSNHNSPTSAESKLIGGAIQENKDKVARANPITYVSKDDPPFLIVHGDQDSTVAHHQSEILYDALRSAGARVRFHTIEGAGHGSGFGGPELEPLVQGFFDRHLKGAKVEGDDPIASTSRSKAFARPGQAEQRPANPATRPAAGVRGGISWDGIRNRADANSDGKVTREEFKGPAPMFDRLDRNRDGSLTADDFGGDSDPRPSGQTSGSGRPN